MSSANYYMRGSLACLTSIAIWNRNKVIVGLSAIVWVTNGTFLIQGKSLSTHHVDELKSWNTWLIARLLSGEGSIPIYFG
jgi:hypothetical protein